MGPDLRPTRPEMKSIAMSQTNPAVLDNLIGLAKEAVTAADMLLAKARAGVREKVVADGKVSAAALEREQFAAHGLAWMATYVEALRQLADYAERMTGEGRFGETEALIVQIAFGEYLWQLYGGIPMSQGEILRPQDMGLSQVNDMNIIPYTCTIGGRIIISKH